VFAACCDGHVCAVVVDIGHILCTTLVHVRRDDISEHLQFIPSASDALK
jgi:hypothetical protein